MPESTWLATLASLLVLSSLAAAEPIRIGSARQLFVDDYLIESTEGLRRTVHRWEKHPENPVLPADKPWENGGNYILAYGGAIYDQDDGIFKMWYWTGTPRPEKEGDPPRREVMCYATSPDGVYWQKPDLGIYVWAGSPENNIVMSSEGDNMETYGVIKTPFDPDPKRLYKACFWEARPDGRRGVWTATSSDGLHWIKSDTPIAPKAGDTVGFLYDSLHGKYICFVKIHTDRGRSRAQVESEDFVTWAEPRLIMKTDDEDDQPCDLYNNSGFVWGDMLLGWLQVFYQHQDPYKSRLVLELIHSRDGRDWHRMRGRETVLDVGPDGSWDRTNQSQANGAPIIVGDRMYMYYGGRTYYHKPFQGGESNCNIGLGTMRLDGFVSMDANPLGGTLTTKPLVWQGDTLHVNVESDWGHCHVELLEDTGEPVAGLEGGEAEDIHADTVDAVVTWAGSSSVASRAGKPTRLRFRLQNARLYSFWVE